MADKKVPPYAELKNFRIDGSNLHIDGYPQGAYVVKIGTKKANRLVTLRAHQSALEFCARAMQDWGGFHEDKHPAREAMLVGIAVKYFSCFGKNAVTGPLSAKRVFAGKPDALECFKYWKDVRDKHLVHNESALTAEFTALVLRESGDVQDVLSMRATVVLIDRENLQLLYDLIAFTLDFVKSEIDNLLPRIFDEARAMPSQDRMTLPRIAYSVPEASDVQRTRTR